MLINSLGMLCLLLGLLVTIPITIVACAFVYRRLSANVEGMESLPETGECLRM
ncbi:MAG: hypothetical protein ABH886_05345 [Candidatus Desantisbacteria bacterium]